MHLNFYGFVYISSQDFALLICQVRYGNECVRQQVSDIENLQKHADNTLLYLQQLDSTATDAGGKGPATLYFLHVLL